MKAGQSCLEKASGTRAGQTGQNWTLGRSATRHPSRRSSHVPVHSLIWFLYIHPTSIGPHFPHCRLPDHWCSSTHPSVLALLPYLKLNFSRQWSCMHMHVLMQDCTLVFDHADYLPVVMIVMMHSLLYQYPAQQLLAGYKHDVILWSIATFEKYHFPSKSKPAQTDSVSVCRNPSGSQSL